VRVGVVARYVGTSIDDPASGFILDEMLELARLGVEVHAIRLALGSPRVVRGAVFHNTTPVQVFKGLARLMVREWRLQGPLPLLESVYACEVEEIAKRCDIDLLHAHFAYPAGFTAAIVKKRLGMPLVVTVHGYDVLVDERRRYGIRLKRGFEKAIRAALMSADRVVVNSKCLYDAVTSLAPLEDVVLIHQGVDLRRFKPRRAGWLRRKLGVGEGELAVFTLKEHNRISGIEYLILAFSQLVERGVRGVKLVIGGSGPLTPLYVKLAHRLGVGGLVKFTGRISRIQVPWYMSAADVYVQPSLLEGFGLALTEAMACAKPVVASRVGGLLDQVVDGFNGLLVEPADWMRMADALQYLVENPGERRRMGSSARRIVEEKFSLRTRALEILKLYEELM